MQKLYDFENRQEASAVEKALEEFGIIASIQEHEGAWSLSVPNSDEERARERLKTVFDVAFPPNPIGFWSAVGFSLSIIFLLWLFLTYLTPGLNFFVSMAIAIFTIAITIVNLPIERKRG